MCDVILDLLIVMVTQITSTDELQVTSVVSMWVGLPRVGNERWFW